MEYYLLHILYNIADGEDILRIRLKNEDVIIEVSRYSQQFEELHRSIINIQSNKLKKELFLKSLYFHCAKKANYHDITFYKKLIGSSYKHIKIKALSSDPLSQYYKLLGVNKNDSIKTVKKRYLKLAKVYHPDKISYANNSLVDEYTRKFQKIQKAYETIKLQNVS